MKRTIAAGVMIFARLENFGGRYGSHPDREDSKQLDLSPISDCDPSLPI
jgi:hypothetical protein